MAWHGELIKIDNNRFKIPKTYKEGMRTDGLIYASEKMLQKIKEDNAPEQVANVATLPGIVGYAMAMPDIHWGYGFPIGGVAAFDVKEGIISPGGVGYDINCGVRILRTDLRINDIKNRIKELVKALFHNVPSGVGSKGKIRIDDREVKEVLKYGAQWALKKGFGWKEDIERIEEEGMLQGADPDRVSKRAIERGRPQLGTLGAGNHFLEIQIVEDIYDPTSAKALGIDEIGQVTVMIHTGSRGLGYQVCDDNVKILGRVTKKYGIEIPDRQLACAPIDSPEGRTYFEQMACAANYAWANRQCIMHWVREAFEQVLNKKAEDLGMHLIYDVAHNIAKFETHKVDGIPRKVCVHRKGATRAFAPGHKEIPAVYREIGQPVIIPGDMGTHSYLLLGTEKAMEQTFGSTCHGAGRLMSRSKAMKQTRGRRIDKELADKGIFVLSASNDVLRQEVPEAYKDIDMVVDAVHEAGISRKVARMRPLGVVKG
ncbi:MAG TPA: RtcB family protein [candidate division WOR-3 bacterium]|uniref:tRNA-splicing ligase RtcB n=1 Tax=candidate division WOR-3 bacterium TaxID=2052148 RepID=A0A9C9JZS4_UNCW3|nr:RtcB family protein [candidate division WOR-3 bacterium]